jgi:general secretion pathway protein M
MTGQELIDMLQGMESRTRQRLGVLLAVILVVVVALSAINRRTSTLERKRIAREADLADMMKLKLQHGAASVAALRLANRVGAIKPDDSPAKIIDQIGIKGKSSSIKPVKGDEIPGYVEDAADVKLEGLTANELANLLFRLEKGAQPVTVKKALIKQRFDDPSRLDVSLTVALIKPAPAGAAGAR